MKIFITELTALDYSDNQIKKWSGDRVHAPTWELAQHYLRFNVFSKVQIKI